MLWNQKPLDEERLEASEGENTPQARLRLLKLLDEGDTGCLIGIRGSVEYRVYVMSGELIAASAESDSRRMLELLRNRRILGAGESADLQRRIAAGESLTELLVETVGEEVLSRMLFERFRENVFEFTSFASNLAYEPMEAIFVDNIQVGHDSLGLLAELDRLRDQLAAAELSPEQVYRRGRTQAANTDDIALLDSFRDQISIEELLRRSPFERSRTLSMLLDLMQRGVLVDVTPPPRSTAPLPPVATDARPTRSTKRAPSVLPLGPPSLPPPDELETPTAPGIEPRRPAPIPPPADAIPDDEMAAFQDNEKVREGGLFTTGAQHLEKLELGDASASPTDTKRILDPIELGDAEALGKDGIKSAVALSFGGRRLEDTDLTRKLDVVNEVLTIIVDTLNEAQPGQGNAKLQLLLEGAPALYIPLFKGVEASPKGHLPADPVIRNLRRRPAAEQRQLFNQGLSDLIDRALSLAGDTLEEDQIDPMLEKIAGYQSRFGL